MKIRCPTHRPQLRDLPLLTAIRIHHPYLRLIPLRRESPPANLLAIRTEKRPAIIPRHTRQPLHIPPIRIRRVDLHEILLVHLQPLRVLPTQLPLISLPVRCKNHPCPIRRIRPLRIIPPHIAHILQRLVCHPILKQLKVLIVIPGILPHPTRRPLLILRLLQLRRLRIQVRRSKHHPLPIRMHPRASRLPRPRRNPLRVPRLQIQHINLVKRIPRLPLALEHHLRPILIKIALTRPLPLKRQLPHPRNKIPLTIRPQLTHHAQRAHHQQKSKSIHHLHNTSQPAPSSIKLSFPAPLLLLHPRILDRISTQ